MINAGMRKCVSTRQAPLDFKLKALNKMYSDFRGRYTELQRERAIFLVENGKWKIGTCHYLQLRKSGMEV